MADLVVEQQAGIPGAIKTRYRDMGDGTHALVIAVSEINAIAFQFDEISAATVGIDAVHHEIHEGEFYSVSYKTADNAPLADDATLAFAITTGAKYLHFQALAACGGDAEGEFYEGSSISGGSAVSIYNHKRNSAQTSTATVVRGPTVNAAGVLLENFFLPGGTGPQAVGSVGNQRQEWILKPLTVYLVRLTNRAGTAQPASLMATFYEESHA